MLGWIVSSKCDHAVTLVFNKSLPLPVAIERLKAWLWEWEKYIFRCRPNRLPAHKRLLAFIVPEHQSTNIHFHLAIRLVDGRDVTPMNLADVIGEAERLWTRAHPYGDIRVERIYDRRGWARYITKDCYKLGTELVLSHYFHPWVGSGRPARGQSPVIGRSPSTPVMTL